MYIFHEDPGHGWIAVPVAELIALNIANQITSCSYIHGGLAYLEEDSDLPTFFEAKKAAGQPLTFDGHNVRTIHKEVTPIRNYNSYTIEAVRDYMASRPDYVPSDTGDHGDMFSQASKQGQLL